MHGAQQEGRASDPFGQRRAVKRDALARIDLCLTIERQVIGVFRDEDLGHRRLGRNAALDQSRRCRRLHHDVLAGSAGVFRSAHHEHAELGRHDVQTLGDILADAMQLAGAARADIAPDIDHHLDPRQVRRQRSSVRTSFARARRLLRRRLLLGLGEAGGLDLLDLLELEQELILGQRLGPPTEAMTLKLLDDLAQSLDLPLARDQHRLKRLRVTGKLWRERGHDPDSTIFASRLRAFWSMSRGRFLTCRDRRRRPLRLVNTAPVEPLEQSLELGGC